MCGGGDLRAGRGGGGGSTLEPKGRTRVGEDTSAERLGNSPYRLSSWLELLWT